MIDRIRSKDGGSCIDADTAAEAWINEVEPLKDLTGLQYLELSGNQVESVEPLAGLVNLRSLYLSKNAISDANVFPDRQPIAADAPVQ